MLGRAPRTKETLPDFCKNMDLDKWDTTVWYLVTRNPQEFHGLTGCQRDPRIWGVTALAQILTSHIAFINEIKATMQNQSTQLNNQATQLRNLKVQMGQMTNLLTERQQGSLPSNSEINPRGEGKEHVKAIKLRSGRELATRGQPPVVREEEIEVVD